MDTGSVFVIVGGQDYWGYTSERDKKICELVGRLLQRDFPTTHLVIGGTPGIPMDIVRSYLEAGGALTNVTAYISNKYKEEFLKHNEKLGIEHKVVGETQEDRRRQLPLIPNVKATIAVQGGKFTTHELKLFQEHNIPIVAVTGSGGAAGGACPWDDGYTFKQQPALTILSSDDPQESPEKMAEAVLEELKIKV